MTSASNILDLVDDAIHALKIWDRRFRHAKSCGREGDVWVVGTRHFGVRLRPSTGDWWSISVYQRDAEYGETTLFEIRRKHTPKLSEAENIAKDCAAAMEYFMKERGRPTGHLH